MATLDNEYERENVERERSKSNEETHKAVAQKKAPALLSHLLMIWVGSQYSVP